MFGAWGEMRYLGGNLQSLVIRCKKKGVSYVWLVLLEWEVSPFCEKGNMRGRTGLEKKRNDELEHNSSNYKVLI